VGDDVWDHWEIFKLDEDFQDDLRRSKGHTRSYTNNGSCEGKRSIVLPHHLASLTFDVKRKEVG